MARKRMFDIEVVDTDLFLDMPQSSQNLYFHLGMRADDDGFISNPKKIVKIIGANEDDLKVLFSKQFLIPFESGVVVIRHWKLNNFLRKDRHIETIYKSEKSMLTEDDNGVYSLPCKTLVNQNETIGQPSIEEKRIEKYSKEKNSIEEIKKKERKNQTVSYDEILNEQIEDDELKATIYDFIKMRSFIKKPLTDRALKMMIKKLHNFSNKIDVQIQILNNSIMNNWTDIYALKNENKNKNNQKGSIDDFKEIMEEVIQNEHRGNNTSYNTFGW